MQILIVNFNLDGLSEEEFASSCDELAPAFAAVPGLPFGGVGQSGFGRRWYVGQERGAFRCEHRQGLQRAGFQMTDGRGQHVHWTVSDVLQPPST